MRIGDVAKSAGVGVETIRFYEHKGLIEQPQKPQTGGYRDYPTTTVRRLHFIRSAQHLGFSLKEISQLLELNAGDTALCVDVRQRAKTKRAEVRIKIDNLMRIDWALDRLIEACPGQGSAQKCSILGAINNGELHLLPLTKEKCDDRQKTKN